MAKNLEGMISTQKAAKLLELNPRTVRRYAEKGLLDYSIGDKGYYFSKNEINLLKIAIRLVGKHENSIKELYVLTKCGAKLENVVCRFDLPDKKNADSALGLYEFERGQYLKRFKLDDKIKNDVLLAEEVAARFRITDKHVVYDLINDGEIKAYESNFKGKKRVFVSLDSFKSYLGMNVAEKFYNSRDASKITGKSVNDIDRIAKSHSIGRKIKTENGHSWYNFNLGEVYAMRYLKRKK